MRISALSLLVLSLALACGGPTTEQTAAGGGVPEPLRFCGNLDKECFVNTQNSCLKNAPDPKPYKRCYNTALDACCEEPVLTQD